MGHKYHVLWKHKVAHDIVQALQEDIRVAVPGFTKKEALPDRKGGGGDKSKSSERSLHV